MKSRVVAIRGRQLGVASENPKLHYVQAGGGDDNRRLVFSMRSEDIGVWSSRERSEAVAAVLAVAAWYRFAWPSLNDAFLQLEAVLRREGGGGEFRFGERRTHA